MSLRASNHHQIYCNPLKFSSRGFAPHPTRAFALDPLISLRGVKVLHYLRARHVGELDQPNRVSSAREYIFCEYLSPFTARGEHALARARSRKARGFMVSPACIVNLNIFLYKIPTAIVTMRELTAGLSAKHTWQLPATCIELVSYR